MDQRARQIICEFVSKNPGLTNYALRAELREIEPDRKKLRFGPNVIRLVNEGRILKIKVMGEEKYYSADDTQAAKLIRQCDDKDGHPLRVHAQFVGAPAFIVKSRDPMEWALKNVLTHA